MAGHAARPAIVVAAVALAAAIGVSLPLSVGQVGAVAAARRHSTLLEGEGT
jgi:hypothetical protein